MALPNTIMDMGFVPPVIETGRIINVNVDDWSVDVITEHGEKRYLDIQMAHPYFHYAGGEGFYVMPEVGAIVWVCKPSDGAMSLPFIMGFQAPFDEDTSSYRSNRQALNPGDIMLRGRDENFIALRRGGVIQIGTTPTAQRMYIPVRNFIRDFCENYQMFTLGGELTWITERTEQTTTGDAPTKFSLLAKELANTPEHIATLTVGSHGEGNNTTLELVVNESGAKDAAQKVHLTIGKDGNVSWDLEGTWFVTAKSDMSFTSEEGNILLESVQGTLTAKAAGDMALETSANMTQTVGGNSTESVTGNKVIDAPLTKIGGTGATEPAVLGTQLATLMGELIGLLATNLSTSPGSPTSNAAAIGNLAGKISTILATKTIVS